MNRKIKSVGLLSPGELGIAVSRRLQRAGIKVATVINGRSDKTQMNAQTSNLSIYNDFDQFVSDNDLFISLVTPENAGVVAENIAKHTRRLDITKPYIDCNSNSPKTKKKIEDIFTGLPIAFIDGVFLGSAAMIDTKTRLFLSGKFANEISQSLTPALRVHVLGDKVGDASALKMCFAEFNKGLIALFLEIVAASRRSDNYATLVECIRDFYPETYNTLWRLLPSYPNNCDRRVQEIGEMVEFLKSNRLKPLMASSVERVLQSFSKVMKKMVSKGVNPNEFTEDILKSICMDNEFLSLK